MNARLDAHLRPSDAFAWYMEKDPALRSTVVSVMWLDHAPKWEELVERVDRSSRLTPGFRMKVVVPPLRLATPRWTNDADFDLSWHLRRIDAPPPHDRHAVLELARIAAMGSFDRDRPLWEFTLVEGMEGGEAAFILKVHHSLTDGVGGMQMALLLFDLERDAPVQGPMPDLPPAERFDTITVLSDALVTSAEKLANVVRRGVTSMVPTAVGAVLHPRATVARAAAMTGSVYRMVKPLSDTRSPVMQQRGTSRRLATIEVPLADLKGAAEAAGGTVNDAFMAGVTGGLRRYHDIHGAAVADLRVTVPISIRRPDDPVGGNRITLQRLTVPVGVADAPTRMHAIHDVCRAARDEPSLGVTDAVAAGLNLLPPSYLQGVLKHVDFLASNVPGIDAPIYLAGAEVTGWFPFGPTIGSSVNVTLLSYRSTCWVGITIDTDAVTDPDVLVECLREGFAEVAAVNH
jgi:WS/DGAT/MGAT family acyltransferase